MFIRSRNIRTTSLLLLIALISLFVYSRTEKKQHSQNQNNTIETEGITVIAEDLYVPWGIVFLPDGDMLVTERNGILRRIGTTSARIQVPSVAERGEGGLLGIALHPEFTENNFLYLYLTADGGGTLINRVERYIFRNNMLTDKKIILNDIPGASYHDGGRIAFGPDGFLYITTGDAGRSDLAQNTTSLAGKILRLTDDGSIPQSNPYNNSVYSYGHRNSQGIAWDETGKLWSTEHGRSGIQSGYDEVNHIEPGVNYGWPTIEGDSVREAMRIPAAHSGPRSTWAPASAVYYKGSIFFGGLRGEAVYEAVISDNTISEIKTHLKNQYGRIRTVTVGSDNFFYIATSNRDGRGEIENKDDRIIRLNPNIFGK